MVVLVVVATLGLTRPSPAAATTGNPIGVHSMLQLDDPPSFMEAMFAQAAALHASAIRLDVAPGLIFPSPTARPDFTGLDEVVSLSERYQLPVLADLVSLPWWIASCPDASSQADMPHCATDDLAGYAAVIARIVRRAAPVIQDWEIWNEPDSPTSFHGTPEQYALMLRAAHDAIKAVEPAAQVLLGGISSTASIGWVAQMFATPGADAAGAFDIAAIHERAPLDALAGDVTTWQRFLAAAGFSGPLWVTEHGYPSDPAFQYDGAFAGGAPAQAAYLAASIPTLLDAGAAGVFVTLRDNLTGAFASEGLLGGTVADPPVPAPQIVPKQSFGVVQAITGCYLQLGHDCPGPAPAAGHPTAAVPSTPPRTVAAVTVRVSDPSFSPIPLGPTTLTGSPSLSIAADGCVGVILEPDRPCLVTVSFRPTSAGPANATLRVDSAAGALSVQVSARSIAVRRTRLRQLAVHARLHAVRKHAAADALRLGAQRVRHHALVSVHQRFETVPGHVGRIVHVAGAELRVPQLGPVEELGVSRPGHQ